MHYYPPGRASTPEQKREVIEKVYDAWVAHPDLRLGQLIINCVAQAFKVSAPNESNVLFYQEDFPLADCFSEFKN